MVVHSYGFTAYEFFRTYLPLPHRTTLWRHYQPRIELQEEYLSEIPKIPLILGGRVPFQIATIAVDAVSLDNVFLSDREIKSSIPQPSHAFVYECLPLTTDERCFPIHVLPALSGNATDTQTTAGDAIVNVLSNLNPPVRVLFIATDGDKGYDRKYESQFNVWFPKYRDHGLTACLESLRSIAPFYLGDFLHLTKNVRSRLLGYIPVLRVGAVKIQVRWAVMEQHLHLGPVFSDVSSAGKMRDSYPIALFRLRHVRTLFCKSCVGEAVYLLPWTLAMVSFRSAAISKKTRFFLLSLTLVLFAKLYTDLSVRPRYLNEQGPKGSKVLPLKRITLIRVMATIAGLLYTLHDLDGDIPLDRLSTHPLENFFGLLRRLLHDCNKFDELLRAAARNSIIAEIFHELDHPRDICGRENQGGVVSRDQGRELEDPTFTVEDAAEQILDTVRLYKSGRGGFTDQALAKMEKVMLWIESLERITSTKFMEQGGHFTIRATANSKIMASLLQHPKPPKAKKRRGL
jgi:hypothetical protein